MRIRKNKIYRFDLDIYCRNIYIVVLDYQSDYSILNKYFAESYTNNLLRTDNLDEYGAVTWCTITHKLSKRRGILIMLRPNMTNNDITHESIHGAIDICNDLGIKFDYENNEALAYLGGYISKCCNKVMDLYKKKK